MKENILLTSKCRRNRETVVVLDGQVTFEHFNIWYCKKNPKKQDTKDSRINVNLTSLINIAEGTLT